MKRILLSSSVPHTLSLSCDAKEETGGHSAHTKCHYAQAQYSLLLWCVLMTYEQFACKWQRQHQTQPIKQNQREVQLSFVKLKSREREGKVPSIFISIGGKRSMLLEGALPVLKIQHVKKGGKYEAQGLEKQEEHRWGKNHGQEGHKATQNTLVCLWSCMQANTFGMTLLGGAQCEFPYLSPVVQQQQQQRSITYLTITLILRNVLSVTYSTSGCTSNTQHKNSCTMSNSAVEIMSMACMPSCTLCPMV